ncbi:hypothetical protein [Brassicibacter mesophilus]|uniref:hypothetical protein n=1 Tax=Brassicibacter mesophilus TaxID=745119 RepID=UPI003D1C2B02
MIKLLRQHLKQNTKLMDMLDTSESIYHIEKPLKCEDTTFIVIKDKLLEDKFIKTYQLTFNIESPDLEKVIAIEEELISYLNDSRDEKIIKNEEKSIRNISVLNGGGKVRTPEDNWLAVVFFLLKI